jgi:hypothetical protein
LQQQQQPDDLLSHRLLKPLSVFAESAEYRELASIISR